MRDVVRHLGDLSQEMKIYVTRDEVPVGLETSVLLVPLGEKGPQGWRYLLEVSIAQKVVDVWSAWRDDRVPSPAEACEAIVFYADNDAYLPAEHELRP